MQKHLKDYFIPHEGNEYKPRSLQKAAMTGMVAMVLLSFTLANVQSFLWIASDWMVSTVLPGVIVDLTNEERSDQTLGQLRRNATLDSAARMKAQHMAEKEYFAHFSPNGVSPWYWFAQSGYNFVHAGENLAIHFTDSGEVMDAWMDSPTHRANIVNGNYTEIGVGTAEGTFEGFKTVYVVQLFGTPAGQPAVTGNTIAVAQAAETPVSTPVTVPPVEETVVLPVVTPVVVEVPEETEVLAQAVEITEDVSVVKADPLPVTVVTPLDEPEVTESEDIVLVTDDEPTEPLFSDFMSTSTGAIPASIDPGDISQSNTPYFLELLTQPTVALQLMYAAIALVVFVSLLLSIGIEIRRQHPMQIAYSMALLLLMFGLFRIHEILSVGAVIV